MRRVLVLLCGSLLAAGLPFAVAGQGAESLAPAAAPVAAPDAKPATKLECLKAAETREEVRARHFIEPFAAVKIAARESKAEALSVKLCHLGDEWIYSVALLQHDGHTAHIWLDAASGRIVPNRPHDTVKN